MCSSPAPGKWKRDKVKRFSIFLPGVWMRPSGKSQQQIHNQNMGRGDRITLCGGVYARPVNPSEDSFSGGCLTGLAWPGLAGKEQNNGK